MIALWKVVNSSEGRRGKKEDKDMWKEIRTDFWIRVNAIDVNRVKSGVWKEVRSLMDSTSIEKVRSVSCAAASVA